MLASLDSFGRGVFSLPLCVCMSVKGFRCAALIRFFPRCEARQPLRSWSPFFGNLCSFERTCPDGPRWGQQARRAAFVLPRSLALVHLQEALTDPGVSATGDYALWLGRSRTAMIPHPTGKSRSLTTWITGSWLQSCGPVTRTAGSWGHRNQQFSHGNGPSKTNLEAVFLFLRSCFSENTVNSVFLLKNRSNF